jgi:hypothetical protein
MSKGTVNIPITHYDDLKSIIGKWKESHTQAINKIAELEKKLSLRAKRINAAIDVIDSDSEDCKFEAVSILSGENDEALREQE